MKPKLGRQRDFYLETRSELTFRENWTRFYNRKMSLSDKNENLHVTSKPRKPRGLNNNLTNQCGMKIEAEIGKKLY